MQKARAQFANNFFSSAAYNIKDNDNFKTIEDGLLEIRKTNYDIVVLCSSDDEYLNLVKSVKKELKEDMILVVAGYPKKEIDNLKREGVGYFIHSKTNLLEALQEFNKRLL